ncbi:MAG: hypothetical protein J0I34_26210 [Pseudonocardia sp.]|uniref:hypothetical protein n=1 Tax=unclassified Pseudonocardia TaxID=2619320 RepID=UPI0008689DD5|nr:MULTISPECIES: hypothetical protein [unclassified Pseudonocardia]MBN9112268.1 hypothetical protein [Pseudonocardia sp.]ODU99815.1 MAG: hypothetical protein ABT15_30925 [Pseudonocardia sp. SCN 73-27]
MFKSHCHSGSKYGGHDKSWDDDYGKGCHDYDKKYDDCWDDKYSHCDDKRYDDCWDDKSYEDKCHTEHKSHCDDSWSHSSSYSHH